MSPLLDESSLAVTIDTLDPAVSLAEPDPARMHVLPKHAWAILAIVCIAQFMVVLDATVTNVAMPSIGRDLKLSAANLQWIVTAYTLTFGGFLLLGGRAADLIGRKRLFLAGLALFSVASLINGVAADGVMLIVARGVQGLGGALVSPAALSIVTDTFPEGPARTRAMGVWAAVATVGSAFGLLLGGMLTSWASWRWAFFINVPVGILTGLFAVRYLIESRGELEHRSFDLGGAATVTGGLVALVYALSKATSWGWGSGKTIGVLALAVGLLVLFVVLESIQRAPLVRLGIFRLRSLVSANATMFLAGGAMFSMFFFLGLYVQDILGYSPVKAGVAFLPASASLIVGAMLSTTLMKLVDIRVLTTTGLVFAAVGMALNLRITEHTTYAGGVLPGMLPLMVGMGMLFVPITLIATTNVGKADMGLASGLFNTSQQIGGALGLAVLSSISTNHANNLLAKVHLMPATCLAGTPSSIAHAATCNHATVQGYHLAYLVSVVLLVGAVAIFLATIRKRDVANIEAGNMAAAHAG